MDAQNIIVGKFLRPHGVDGKIKVESYTDPKDSLCNYTPWLLEDHTQLTVLTYEKHHTNLVVVIQGVTTREQASLLTNALILTPLSQLPPPDEGEYYWHQLEGLRVVNHLQQELGRIAYLTEGSQCDLIVVTTQAGDDIIVPYEKSVVKGVDLTAGVLSVEWHDPKDL